MRTADLLRNVRRIEIRTRKIVQELTAGAYHSVFKGQGIEFEEVREYVPGDDIRSIDWNVTARFGAPFVKEYTEERELNVILLVDISASGDFGSTSRSRNEVAAELAAVLAFSAVRNNDRVGLLLFSDEPELFVPPRKGSRHVLRLIRELLAHQRRNRGTSIRNALQYIMRMLHRRAIVFLISDMLDENFEQALRIAGRRHDVVTLRLIDPTEERFPRCGYVAAEDAETADITIFNSLRERNRSALAETTADYRRRQREIFQNAGQDLVDITAGEDIVKPLLQFFHFRERRRH